MKPSIFHRFMAYLVDLSVGYLCALAAIRAASIVITDVFQFGVATEYRLMASFQETMIPLTFVAVFAYFFYVNYFMKGKSLGCIYFNFTVLNNNYQNLTFKESLARSGIQTLFLIAWNIIIYAPLLLLPLFRKDRKGMADLFSNSQCYRDQFLSHPFPAPLALSPPQEDQANTSGEEAEQTEQSEAEEREEKWVA